MALPFIQKIIANIKVSNAVMTYQSLYGLALVSGPYDHDPMIATDYLILISEKNLQFRKDKSIWQGIFIPPRKNNWIQMLQKFFFEYVKDV